MKSFTEPMSILAELNLTAVRMAKKLDRGFSVHGISFNEFLIMHFLTQSQQATLSRIELAESLGITASGITRMLNPMEKNHLVDKQSNPRDARVSLVKLTDTGKKLYAEAFNSFEHQAQSLLPDIRQYQAETLLAFLSKL